MSTFKDYPHKNLLVFKDDKHVDWAATQQRIWDLVNSTWKGQTREEILKHYIKIERGLRAYVKKYRVRTVFLDLTEGEE